MQVHMDSSKVHMDSLLRRAINSKAIQDMTRVLMDNKQGRLLVHRAQAMDSNQLLSRMTPRGVMEVSSMDNSNRVDMVSKEVIRPNPKEAQGHMGVRVGDTAVVVVGAEEEMAVAMVVVEEVSANLVETGAEMIVEVVVVT